MWKIECDQEEHIVYKSGCTPSSLGYSIARIEARVARGRTGDMPVAIATRFCAPVVPVLPLGVLALLLADESGCRRSRASPICLLSAARFCVAGNLLFDLAFRDFSGNHKLFRASGLLSRSLL